MSVLHLLSIDCSHRSRALRGKSIYSVCIASGPHDNSSLLDSLHQALLIYYLWSSLIDDFNNPSPLLSVDWSYQALLVTSVSRLS
jgi:hypothetical protein